MSAPSGRPRPAPPVKPGLHPRNRHASGYDFVRLVRLHPELETFVRRAPHGGPSIDFADPEAVKTLNRALLAEAYGIRGWDLPAGYLCPPIPGRADYLHHLADLLASDASGSIPRGPHIRGLDVGTGASLIYPLIGHGDYGWTFVGTDIDSTALDSARRILSANPACAEAISLRRQAQTNTVFAGVLSIEERFDFCLCNPPFHGSLKEARTAAQDKWRKLGHDASRPARNFGGQGSELWCDGGEAGFLRRMIEESVTLPDRVKWFTSLVSKSMTLPGLQHRLRQVGATEIRVVPMAQGQKQSRFLAWSFLSVEARRSFRATSPKGTP